VKLIKDNNILFISSEFPPGPGGISNHAYNLAKQFTIFGNNVHVITKKRREFPNINFDSNSELHITRYASNLHLFSWTNFATIFFSHYLKNQYEYIIASGLFEIIFIGLLQKILHFKSVIILHGHEALMGSWFTKLLFKISINSINNKIAVSHFAQENLMQISPLSEITIINNGFDISRMKQYSQGIKPKMIDDKSRIKLITVGTVCHRKGQHNVINAFNLLKSRYPFIEYHIVGLPHDDGKIKKLAIQHNVEQNIFIHGELNDAEMIKLLQSCDIFVLLSENQDSGDVEGFGIAILEANFLGLPAIGALGCGIEDAIEDGNNGKLINPFDQNELLSAINEITYLYSQYSKRAMKKVQNSTWEHIAKKYCKLLNLNNE